jgi:hypothetical protein
MDQPLRQPDEHAAIQEETGIQTHGGFAEENHVERK